MKYLSLRVVLRALTLGLVAELAVACANSSTGNATPADISGAWQFTFSIAFSNTSCTTKSDVKFVESSTTLSGNAGSTSVSCTPSGTSSNYAVNGTLGGSVGSLSLTFIDDSGCTYNGSITGDPTNAMSGTFSCTTPFEIGGNHVSSGTWIASR